MGIGNTVFRNKIKIWFLYSAMVVIAVWILFMPSMVKYQKGSNNIFKVILNDVEVGTVENKVCLVHFLVVFQGIGIEGIATQHPLTGLSLNF